jgi:hypothetical protein
LLALAGSVAAGLPAATPRVRFAPYLWVLTAFWVYVAVSNLLYAASMQASLKVEHVFAPASARLLQHLFLYPLFILCMWRALRAVRPGLRSPGLAGFDGG